VLGFSLVPITAGRRTGCAATVGVPLEERALAPAEVLEADEDGRTLELGAGVVERVDASKSAPLWAESVFIVGVLIT
jgi:hypothetical protein